MADKIIEIGLAPVEEWYGSEVMLHYPGLYAGSTDLVCLHNGKETIVDFKQANRPKKEEWIEDYYLQIAMYAMAHDYVYGSKIEQGVIMVCTPDLYYQEFKTEGADLRAWKHKALKRINMYNEMRYMMRKNKQRWNLGLQIFLMGMNRILMYHAEWLDYNVSKVAVDQMQENCIRI